MLLNSKHAIGVHGFILVYSVTSRNSFDMIQIIYDKIINFCSLRVIPCIIIGAKTDLQQRCVFGPTPAFVFYGLAEALDRLPLARVRSSPEQAMQRG